MSEPTGPIPPDETPPAGQPPFPPPPGTYPPPPGYQLPPYPPVGYVDPTLKSRLVAGLLGVFLGAFGVHRFYLGYTGIGIAQIAVTLLTCGIGSIWGLIEGILILFGSTITTDATGRPLRE